MRVAEGDGDTLRGGGPQLLGRTTTSGEDLEYLGQYKQIDVQWVLFGFVLLLIFHNRKQEAAGGIVGGGVLGVA